MFTISALQGRGARIGGQIRLLGVVLLVLTAGPGISAQRNSADALLFARKCTSCHTIGRGKLVGPDLKGVAARRERSWLQRFIRSSRQVILSRDPIAMRLFAEFGQQRMPDQDLSAEQIDALIDYLAEASTTEVLLQGRPLDRATEEDVRLGFDLFVGKAPLSEHAPPCSTCHAIRHPWAAWPVTAASFAPALSRAYSKYGDHTLLAMIRRACASNGPVPEAARLTPEESFAVSAFLRDAAKRAVP